MGELIYIPDFISEEKAQEIIALVPKAEQNGKGRNQVLRFGSRTPYPSDMISSDIPEVFNNLNLQTFFDSVTINEYFADQIIDYHIDLPASGNKIHILSLGSEWKHKAVALGHRYSIVFRNSKEKINKT